MTEPLGTTPHHVVVVTGTGGMGVAIARRLGPGHQLVLADVSADVLGATAALLRGEGHTVHDIVTDVSDAASVAALAEGAAALGPIAAVVHTAGVSPTQASSERIVAVDVVGTALILDAFGAVAGPGTVGVCIASMSGSMLRMSKEDELALATTPTAELAALPALDPTAMDPGIAYSTAKRANQLRVEAASVAWGAKGARVVSISPGIISTPMGQQELAGEHGDGMRTMIEMSGTKRLGTPDDIAAAVEFLVSPAASFVTGTDLLVDGGAVAALRAAGVI
jgi:NAD(P)-dependent dehydrogenase (short-subunit alcohol dehydrogenase family)